MLLADNGKYLIKPGTGKLDEAFGRLFAKTLPAWRALGFTPNMVTTVTLVLSAASLWFFHRDRPFLAFLCVLGRMYTDTIDGMAARAYDLESQFGDYYDHVVDWSWMVGVFVISMRKFRGWSRWAAVAVFAVAAVAAGSSVGCSEIDCGGACQHNESLGVAKMMCVRSLAAALDCAGVHLMICVVMAFAMAQSMATPSD